MTLREITISNLPVDELNKLKRAVKNDLKRYDQTFLTLFYRQPNKQDKEPLRPLYMYYKKLKQFITKKEQSGGDNKRGVSVSTT